ncbi:hypothetical protein BIW11_11799 [Tropilaelaps mercedesae]|uniref:Uncharacterized protein n=1 Tax=Tropilaelaps mercedesae TaxID=418985 RepID=A0A1V9X9E7_9ACAR|nr:hypothetical protein BIW11_11799 [Tropilaelaps mercedesae]
MKVPPAQSDLVHLLQAKEIAKRVPDNMQSIRRIVEFSRASRDQGKDPNIYTPTPIYVSVIIMVVAFLYVSFTLSAFIAYLTDTESAVPVRRSERQELLPNPKGKVLGKAENARKGIVDEIRHKLAL